MSAALMRQYCYDAGLQCVLQEIFPPESCILPIDCLTIFFRSGTGVDNSRTPVFRNMLYGQSAQISRTLAKWHRMCIQEDSVTVRRPRKWGT
jgi:hypothetical protein